MHHQLVSDGGETYDGDCPNAANHKLLAQSAIKKFYPNFVHEISEKHRTQMLLFAFALWRIEKQTMTQ